MKTLLTLLMAGSLIAGIYAPTAEAARVGGGRTMGIQRSVTPPPEAPLSRRLRRPHPRRLRPRPPLAETGGLGQSLAWQPGSDWAG